MFGCNIGVSVFCLLNEYLYICEHANVFSTNGWIPGTDGGVQIPTGADSGGFCDRHVVCASKVMTKCLSFIDPWLQQTGLVYIFFI
jgi:hypothetical protein